MALLTKDELLRLARISNVMVDEHEIPALLSQLSAVLSYAERVNAIVQHANNADNQQKQCNVMREDVVQVTDAHPIMAQAPETDGNYFVVPMILEK